MPLTKIDDKGRILLPIDLRRKLNLKEGDEWAIDSLGKDTILLKKINIRAMLEEAIIKAKSIDHDKLEQDIEEESNQLARAKFKIPHRQ